MESNSLERASEYLNNLLLARGLLSNGKPIDFARPDRHGSSTNPTMARIINLVHDLVLRRDQDAEQRENLAIHIRQARADEAQRVLDLQKLQAKNAELSRAAAAAEAQERALKTNVRKLETQAKELREQMLKMKSTLDQVRSKCLSDVRKRDAELDKLKGFLAGLQRGKKDSSGMKINTINWEPEVKGRELRNGQDVNSSEWSLEKETNEFLAALVNETSTENVSLRRIITDTMRIIRDITGLKDTGAGAENEEDQEGRIGTPDHYSEANRRSTPQQPQAEDLTSCDELAEQMTAILGHCQSILKDPSFVPIEEVEIRDEEIIKLRAGWEKMANRWKEAVTMMDNWRRRMAENSEGLSKDDLSRLEFGKSVALLPDGQPVFGTNEELSSILYEASKLEEEEEPDHGEIFPESEQEDIGSRIPTQSDMVRKRPVKRHSTELDLDLDIPLAQERSPKRRASIARKAGNLGKPIRPLQAIDMNNLNASPKPGFERWAASRESADSGIGSLDCAVEGRPESEVDDEDYGQELGKRMMDLESRLPRQIKRQQPVLTIDEKLDAVEAEALATQQDLKSASGTKSWKRKHGVHATKTRKASRRRSTLSPDELAELMGIE
ncbi:uncharacterized protein Z520_11053 [Fonsecaea multimorphosa CBS 102226]|uniref:NIMA interactive protein n=1 Tax=Fonsecaea multimorphosa CBS 102226 TaxID=1442371 RepID=A0A0D2JRX3_9EURO|nr:uncharacterized protein Z520_11053 [Fonsecaea multimorphosa CBS 102226]KIX93199.1 hypothetical protein Z520_11053 [Fonsecaea multimorphosa CBS 102226]OAL18436.1 hypothetical protein AYO22_10632 [Fonsecaea multimorphosa]